MGEHFIRLHLTYIGYEFESGPVLLLSAESENSFLKWS